ncbi:MAG: RlmE family RNA methyltransferase [Rhodospirillales bacterium]|jgi:23S rRNA (uridine2552-2'-O)-methyltransferase|nr:RlmE family RNA methyltransferase [Rhodospirillales bacterium]
MPPVQPPRPAKLKKKHSASSARWLRRQLADPYVAEAKRLGYRSRAAFKLIELDDRFRLLKPGTKVVDLGAAPGGWTQVAVARVRPQTSRGAVVAVDLAGLDPIAGAETIAADVFAPDLPDLVRQQLRGAADVVLSDMAPSASGHAGADHLRIIGLAEAALDLALGVLAPNGSFVCKVWQGGAARDLLTLLKQRFATVRHAKPPASRAESAEVYVVATGYRPEEAEPDR